VNIKHTGFFNKTIMEEKAYLNIHYQIQHTQRASILSEIDDLNKRAMKTVILRKTGNNWFDDPRILGI